MDKRIFMVFSGLIALCIVIGAVFVRSELHAEMPALESGVSFEVEQGESVAAVADKLEVEGIVRSAAFFRTYLSWKKLDTSLQAGSYTVEAPVTLARVIAALKAPTVGEREITIIPGWNIRDIAAYFEKEKIASEQEVLALLGDPAVEGTRPTLDASGEIANAKPENISFEGYLRPDTFRFLHTATAEDILARLVREREKEFTPELVAQIEDSGRTLHEVVTMASILEREVHTPEDTALVADIFWRRYDNGWPLQADSTVHYVTGKRGDVFTTVAERGTDSPWNTYKYPGLPPGPIAMPKIATIRAAAEPKPNDYWYFLTTLDTGEVKYGRTLEEHNRNRALYLQ